ncbi:hypothetical protein NRS6131_10150 [Bacillus subtilis]|uniref:hypothetical protein n=1 Tax=Bacillus subtilis TaxID=1423 RepID=UPI001B9DE91B|nr:hypothetical protein [Bacillus subtilis]CAF1846250.1 hypothetical protein NRS6131_03904 [Bacillus subtilis]CAI6277737.1 hypothetical protein NRS6131_10150 [Bacillus subtilis]
MLLKKEIDIFNPDIIKVGNPIKVIWNKGRHTEYTDCGIILESNESYLIYGMINDKGDSIKVKLEAITVALSSGIEVKIGSWRF